MTHVAILVGGRYFTDENEQMGIVRLFSRAFNGVNNEEPEAKKNPLPVRFFALQPTGVGRVFYGG
jgi:hypothetical protein